MRKSESQSAFIQCYEQIRDKILNGDLAGGTKLVEERLAEEMGVSRTPVRESIRKLEQEGLIKRKRVVQPTVEDLRHIFEVRILLEGYACRCAASYMDEETAERLQECIDVARTGDVKQTMDVNKRFHDIIVQASRNPEIIDIIDRMQSIIYLFRRAVVYHKRPFLIDEHQLILDAIRKHDAPEAERLMQEHLQADLDFYLHLGKG
ncbi:GntR family transcriptional regulator [Paenibacillus sp. JCM 10914]|uniref:GntR family transcriptional regulator n=1 Tax=Paenibacillus sp. JCM 10914 TaxID=1236974 RepID=UPI0003CCAE12|nr:GntR family transcriptional regulator [Paenibacillus sp. JCM 10914]GAE05141.1 transcriptional regulator, GntR family [Paenibacillus sp. JCM 10914]